MELDIDAIALKSLAHELWVVAQIEGGCTKDEALKQWSQFEKEERSVQIEKYMDFAPALLVAMKKVNTFAQGQKNEFKKTVFKSDLTSFFKATQSQ